MRVLILVCGIAFFSWGLISSSVEKRVVKADNPSARTAAATKAASPEMERLWKAFGGDWTTEEQMEKTEEFPNGGARRGESHWRLEQDGRTLIGEGHSNGSAGPLNYIIVMWWNGDAKHYGFFVCFNGGTSACEERGSAHWEGERLVNEYTENLHGKPTRMTDTWIDITPNSHRLVFAVDEGGMMKTWITTRSVKK